MRILITEEQFKTLSGYLMEQSSPDEIYQKYYSKIDKNIFDKIIEADPKTIKGIKIGKYAKLLLNIYKNGNLPMEDLPKASYYLSLVYKYNRSIPKLDLGNCSSLISLGNLKEVGIDLDLRNCSSLASLGNLKEVGRKIFLRNTPLVDMFKSGELKKLYPQFEDEKFEL